MKVTGYVSMGLAGCMRKFSVEVDDDCTDDEIDEAVRDEMFATVISWRWKREES